MRRVPSPVQTATTAHPDRFELGLRFGLGARRLSYPPLLLDLLPQVGHPDAPGAAGLDSRFDGRTDVVGVDVKIPQAVSADDHDRIAQSGAHLTKRRDGLIGRFQEVHDLIAQSGGIAAAAMSRPGRHVDRGRVGATTEALRTFREGASVGDMKEGVEEQHEAGAPSPPLPRP